MNKHTGEIEETQSTPRRKTASNTSASVNSLILLTMVTCCLLGSPQAAATKFTKLNSSGLMYMHESNKMMQTGNWHLEIGTTFNTTKYIGLLAVQSAQISSLCYNIWEKRSRFPCHDQIAAVEQFTELAINKMSVHSRRRKRSRGIIGFLGDLIFGSNEEEEIDAIRVKQREEFQRLSEILKSSLSTVQQKEMNIQQEINNFQNRSNIIVAHLNQVQHLTENIDENQIHIKFIEAYESAMMTISLIRAQYMDTLSLSGIKQGDVSELYVEIQHLLPSEYVVPVKVFTINNLRLLPREITVKEGTLTININIPILYNEIFESFQVLSVPDIMSNTRINVEHQYIAVNHHLSLYFFPQLTDKIMEIGNITI